MRCGERTPRRIALPYLLLGGAQLAVGAAAIFARLALGGAQPLAVAASRLVIAAGLLLGLAFLRRGTATRPTPHQARTLALAGIALAVHFAAWIASLQYTTVAVSTLLVTTTPIWTAMHETLFRKRTLSRAALLAFLAGGVGLVMVVGFDRTAPPIPGHEPLGAALALLGSFAIGAYLLLVREVREVRNALDTRAIVTHTYAWAALALVLAALLTREPPPPIAASAAWGGILAMAFISQLLGHTAINASLRWFSPSAVSFATLLEPAIAGALALAIFHEAIAPVAILGAATLLGAIGIVLREERLAFETEL